MNAYPKRGRASREENAERRCAAILDAAVALFAEKGYSDADTQELSDRLKVGKGTLYRYFPSKRELFLAAVDRVMRRLSETIDLAIVRLADPLDRISVGVETFLEYFDANPTYTELIIQERALFKDRTKPTYIEHRERNFGRWKQFYRDLMAVGRVREMSAERIVNVVSDLVYGTIFTNYFAGRRRSCREQTDDILDVLFHGILAEGERKLRPPPPAYPEAEPVPAVPAPAPTETEAIAPAPRNAAPVRAAAESLD